MSLTDEQKARILEEEKQRLAEDQYREQVRQELKVPERPSTPPSVAPPVPVKAPPANSHTTRNILAFIGTVVALCAVYLLIGNGMHYFANNRAASDGSGPSTNSAPPRLVHQEQKLFSGSIAVNATSMYWVAFTLTPHMLPAHVTGHVQAYGGGHNDIQAVICSEQEFINFQNGHSARVFYDSGKTTVADINVTFPDRGKIGRYVLVFNNRFSTISAKTVNGEITINYDIVQ